MGTEEVWAGEFGDAYHKRNWVDWQRRIPFWRGMMFRTGARSVLELGAGPGWNLSAIHRTCPDVVVGGVEINEGACEMAHRANIFMMDELAESAELVFTVGCLIHIPPDNIWDTMRSIVDASYRHVLCVEYESTEEEEIEYQGQSGLLWKRPYAQMYEELGLKEEAFGRVGKSGGFDNCIWRLMEK